MEIDSNRLQEPSSDGWRSALETRSTSTASRVLDIYDMQQAVVIDRLYHVLQIDAQLPKQLHGL